MGLKERIKSLFRITGTEKGLLELKEIKQQFILVGVGLLLIFQVAIGYIVLAEMGMLTPAIKAKYDKNVAVLMLDKPITNPYINTIIERLEEVRGKKEEFPHLMIVVASGGGSPQGSSELANYLVDLQKEIKVTMYIESVAASGAYYIASAIKHDPNDKLSGIIANENAIVGSIGVILTNLVYKDAADKLGIKQNEITIGKFKSPISGWKNLTPDNELYLKNQLLEPVYNNFLKFVSKGRDIPMDELKELAEGRVYIATESVGKLVDRVSYLTQIKREIKESVEVANPDDEVGFVPVSLSRKRGSLFNVSLNIENLSVGSDLAGSIRGDSQNYGMQ
ncbi:MAG: S49 family peptidase [Campylobacterota bacterium]|nr:S49 family peptidase [Campylobacterota bacterium]